MFEGIFFPQTAEKYRTAPLSEQRARYLRHLNELALAEQPYAKMRNDQLSLVRLLDLREGERVSLSAD